ncbi:MAG: hypothetical protein HY594_01070 [Candidatus Omnitrophica bacterium]|nr:hypothetical protein [Candidatus Omnitrophota bacterium]
MWRLAEIQLPIPLILTPEETLNIPPQFQEAAQIVQVADAASAIEELKQQGLLPIEIDAQALLNVGLEEAQAAAALRRFYQ